MRQDPDKKFCLRHAQEALSLHLFSMEEDGDIIRAPTDPVTLRVNTEPNEIISLVRVFMPRVRDSINNRAVNKTVTLPQWLELEARSEDINFSQTLQDALIKKLGLKKKSCQKI